jgi:hypothetical protein
MAYVYRHIRIDKNVPFYIGVGCSANYARAKEKSRRSDLWKRIISKSDYCIEIIMDDLSWEDACEKEKEFISLYGRIDLGTGTLANMTDGGDGTIGIVFTKERKNKISKILKGRKKTKEHKDKMSKAWLNREPISDETKKKMSDSHKGEKSLWYGKKLSNEHREKMSNSKRFIQDPDSIYKYPLLFNECQIMIDVDKQILSSATILPAEVEKLNGN